MCPIPDGLLLLAYVDPGSGLLLWQAAVAAIVGLVFYLKKTRDWLFKPAHKMFGLGSVSCDRTCGSLPLGASEV